ncbi:MAG: hypothetical protein ABIY70_07325 [Capsulimonas sp.]|uniref:hypothetical protein n=1 Tax=Capsulimonas sp. TaxID=2494211 RepID=UPI0032639692
MKPCAISIFALGVLSTGACAAAPHGSHWIVPGRSIGQTALGSEGAKTLARLPRPTIAESGMSHLRIVWVSREARGVRNTLFIQVVSNGVLNRRPSNGLTINAIRITSPWYRTHGGLATGATLAQIRRQYPQIRPTDSQRMIFDSRGQGIAFEFAHSAVSGSRCIAIMIHPRGDTHTASAEQVAALLHTAAAPPPADAVY